MHSTLDVFLLCLLAGKASGLSLHVGSVACPAAKQKAACSTDTFDEKKFDETLAPMKERWSKLSNLSTPSEYVTKGTAAYEGMSDFADPITYQSIQKSSDHSYPINQFRLDRKMDKLQGGTDDFLVVTLGGSITGGIGCGNDANWPAMMQNMLAATFGSRVRTINEARPGSNAGYVLHRWSKLRKILGRADLIIIEYNYNEAHGYERHGMSDTKRASTSTVENEQLLTLLLGLSNQPAVLYFDLPAFSMGPKLPLVQPESYFPQVGSSLHLRVAKTFGVPIIWYPDAVRASQNLYLDSSRSDRGHPPCFPSHHIMGELVFGWIYQATQQVCKHGVRGHELPLPAISMSSMFDAQCAANALLLSDADKGEDDFKIRSTGNWKFEEDVPGKPGWIAPAGDPTELVFADIPIQSGGMLIEFLKTYENIGSTTCMLRKVNGSASSLIEESTPVKSLESETRPRHRRSRQPPPPPPPPRSLDTPIVLLGRWDNCVSLSYSVNVAGVPPGTYDLACNSDGSKFKITSVTSC